MKPTISVVIPTIGRPQFLIGAIRSVSAAALNAGLQHDQIETVIVDDGGGRETDDLCKGVANSERSLLRYFRSPKAPRGGAAVARNYGIAMAQGEVIYLLDDDDIFLPNRFSRSLRLLLEGRAEGVFETAMRTFTDGSSRDAYLMGPGTAETDVFSMLVSGSELEAVASCATSFGKGAFLRSGGYDEGMQDTEDSEFLPRLALCARIALLPGAPVARINVHGDNTSRDDRLAYWKNIDVLARLHRKIDRTVWPTEAAMVRNCLQGKLDFALSECRRLSPDYSHRIREGAKAIRRFPWACLSRNNLKSVAVWIMRRRAH